MFKGKVVSKSLITIGILLSISIFAYLLYLIILNNPRCYDREYDQGWECRYPQFFSFIPTSKEAEYENKCEQEGGSYRGIIVTKEMTQGGGVVYENTGPLFYCIIPFSDYGTACNSSDFCQGACEFIGEIPDFCNTQDNEVYECSEDIVGTCTAGRDDGRSGRKIVEGKSIVKTESVIY
jgi:hypothetical protein